MGTIEFLLFEKNLGEFFLSENEFPPNQCVRDGECSALKLDRKKPPPPGGFLYLVVSKSRTRRKRTPLEEPTPKLINFGGGSSRGVLFLRVFDQGTQ